MLTNGFEYFVCTIIFLPIIIIRYIKYKKDNISNRLYKIIAFTLFLSGLSILISCIFFPLPIQKTVFDVKYIHTAKNYFIPFQRMAQQYNFYKISNTNLKPYIIGNLLYFIKNITIYLVISFFLCLYKTYKKHLIFLLSLSIIIEILQFFAGLVVGFNYKSLSSEDVLLAFIGFALGYVLYRKTVSKTQKWKKDSNILLLLNKMLLAYKA